MLSGAKYLRIRIKIKIAEWERLLALVVIALICLLGLCGAAVPEPFPFLLVSAVPGSRQTGPKYYELPSGLALIAEAIPGARLTAVCATVGLGAKHELRRKSSGVRYLLGHSMLGGTRFRSFDELHGLAASMGGRLEVIVGDDTLSFVLTVVGEYSSGAIQLLADVVMRPAFEEDEVERARQQVYQVQSAARSEPRTLAYLTARTLIYGDSGYGRPPAGYSDTVARIEEEDLRRFHQTYFRSSNITLAVVGAVDEKEVASQVRSAFANVSPDGVPRLPDLPPVILAENRLRVRQLPTHQAHLLVAFPTVGCLHPDAPALHLLTSLLGQGMDSYVFRSLRGTDSLCYHAYAFYAPHTRAGELAIYVSTKPSNLQRVRQRLEEVLTLVRGGKWTTGEIERAKAYLANQYRLFLQSLQERALALATAEALGSSYEEIDEFLSRIQHLTSDDLQEVASRYLRRSGTVLILPRS